LRRTCISLWLTPWVVLRAISRTCGMDIILTGPADHCRNTTAWPVASCDAACFTPSTTLPR